MTEPAIRCRMRFLPNDDTYANFASIVYGLHNTIEIIAVSRLLSHLGSDAGDQLPGLEELIKSADYWPLGHAITVGPVRYHSPLEIVLKAVEGPGSWAVLGFITLRYMPQLVEKYSRVRVSCRKDQFESKAWEILSEELESTRRIPEHLAQKFRLDDRLDSAGGALSQVESAELEVQDTPPS